MRDPSKQYVYYDPGVGTLAEPGVWTWLGKRISELWGVAFGAGISRKVGEAYSFLMDYWEPGDRVFLFGFSRGAYAVRMLAGLLHLLGLMPHGNHNLILYVLRLYKAGRKEESKYWKLCNEFRWTFARQMSDDDKQRHFHIHFLGVRDTVSSVGWVWEPSQFPNTATNPSIDVIRHAVSIDEHRAFFRQSLMTKTMNTRQDIQELWFPGVHCDVGGGYPERGSGFWCMPFEWLLDNAIEARLLVNEERLENLKKTFPSRPWMQPQHESLKGLWWLAEYFPKMSWQRDSGCWCPTLGRGKPRFVHDGALIHKAVLLRIREKQGYAPPNLSESFLDRVRALPEVPESLPYQP